jgi:hypothetical protein
MAARAGGVASSIAAGAVDKTMRQDVKGLRLANPQSGVVTRWV